MPATTEIRATYRVVTPMFCGGADQQPELRLPSFKGVLRFWWRAAAWARYGGAPTTIRAAEDALFGSAAAGARGGQSRVRLTLSDDQEGRNGGVMTAVEALARDDPDQRSGLRYLAYGMLPQKRDQSDGQRSCRRAPFSFTVRARYRPRKRASGGEARDQRASLQEALTTAGLVGGLGARSRKGFGSLVLTELTIDDQPQPLPTGAEALVRTGLPEHATGGTEPTAYTAFACGAEHLVVRAGHLAQRAQPDPLSHLGAFGGALKAHLDDPSVTAPGGQARLRRAAFGLPRHIGQENDPPMTPAGEYDRRASPLFVHVHEFGGQPALVLSFLPSRFLPQAASSHDRPAISVGYQKHPLPPEEELYQPVREFLDRLRREWTVLADTRVQEGVR